MEWISKDLPEGVRSYLIGLTFGVVASPCSTPVLATLLAWVATTQDLILGGVLLLSYTAGYVAPLILAGTFTASIKKLLELRRWSGWITPVSGALLVGLASFLCYLEFLRDFLINPNDFRKFIFTQYRASVPASAVTCASRLAVGDCVVASDRIFQHFWYCN
jgi:hypothetical protein